MCNIVWYNLCFSIYIFPYSVGHKRNFGWQIKQSSILPSFGPIPVTRPDLDFHNICISSVSTNPGHICSNVTQDSSLNCWFSDLEQVNILLSKTNNKLLRLIPHHYEEGLIGLLWMLNTTWSLFGHATVIIYPEIFKSFSFGAGPEQESPYNRHRLLSKLLYHLACTWSVRDR